MNKISLQLQDLQKRIGERNDKDWIDDHCEKLFWAETDGLFHVEFYGDSFDDSFMEFSHLLCRPEVAASIKSLVFRGPDEGANGTKSWDFTTLLRSDTMFPNLTSFFVEPTQPHHHNQSIIGAAYEEKGMIASLTAKMPRIQSLTVPAAPNDTFFTNAKENLSWLRIETGYDHQNFIYNLSQSASLPNLTFLDFGDYCQTYLENYRANCTPFTHYVELFKSAAFAKISYFRLRNPSLSQEQLQELKKLKRDLQFHIVYESGNYVE